MALRNLRRVLLASLLVLPVVLTVSPAGAAPQPLASTPINCTAPAGGTQCPTPDPSTPYGGLDHYLCYDVSSDPFTTPEVTVQDQYGTLGPLQPQVADSSAPTPTSNWFCNPFQKTVLDTKGSPTGPVYGVSNAQAHLMCFNDSGPAPGTQVSVTNQLGSATLVVGAPTRLCLPSWKFDDAANQSNPLAVSGSVSTTKWTDPSNLALNHFQCYKVTIAPGTTNNFTSAWFGILDQFGWVKEIQFGSSNQSIVPDELCAPAVKTVVDAAGHALTPPSTINGDGFTGTHLLCFAWNVVGNVLSLNSTAMIPPVVQVGNQFSQSPVAGTPGAVPAPVTIDFNDPSNAFTVVDDFCFPSFKMVLPNPSTPETPIVVVFPVGALGLVGGAAVLARRRNRITS
jgi:hypothetical protein